MKNPIYGLFIISFNRLEVLKESMSHFKRIFAATNIYIIDKGSDYQPLIEYYKELHQDGTHVILSDPMIGGPDGPGGLNDLHKEIDKYKNKFDYYAVTDPDIALEGCDEDILTVYANFLELYPDIDIVGPMLKIDDIPEGYPAREWCYRRHVDQFWSKKPEKIAFNNKDIYFQKAKIDSTFGLLRSTKSFTRLLDGIRVYNPYEAKHLDWYIIPDDMTPDQKNYMDKSNKLISNWGAKHYKSSPLHPILTKEERLIYTTTCNAGKVALVNYQLPLSPFKFIPIYNLIVNLYLGTKKALRNLNRWMRRTAKAILNH